MNLDLPSIKGVPNHLKKKKKKKKKKNLSWGAILI
jgi:hypothetical protein